MPKKVSQKQSVKATKAKDITQTQKVKSVKQNQRVTVNIIPKASKSRAKSAPSPAPYIRQPNSIGYALNSQVYSIPQPRMYDYNTALAGMNTLQANQMKTGSLIPNQQVNSLYSTIRATPRQESLGDNPFTRQSRNTQPAMLDPYEGELENVAEFILTQDAYDPDPSGQISVGVGQTLEDLPAGIVKIGANDELILKEMSASLKGLKSKMDNFALGERASQSIAPSISSRTTAPLYEYQRLQEKAMSETMDELRYYVDANLEETLAKQATRRTPQSDKKRASLGAVIAYPAPPFTPEEKVGRGRKKGSKNKAKDIIKGLESEEL